MLDSATDRQNFPVVIHFATAKSHFFSNDRKVKPIYLWQKVGVRLKVRFRSPCRPLSFFQQVDVCVCAFLVFVYRALPHFCRAILDYYINTIVLADSLVLLFLVCMRFCFATHFHVHFPCAVMVEIKRNTYTAQYLVNEQPSRKRASCIPA